MFGSLFGSPGGELPPSFATYGSQSLDEEDLNTLELFSGTDLWDVNFALPNVDSVMLQPAYSVLRRPAPLTLPVADPSSAAAPLHREDDSAFGLTDDEWHYPFTEASDSKSITSISSKPSSASLGEGASDSPTIQSWSDSHEESEYLMPYMPNEGNLGENPGSARSKKRKSTAHQESKRKKSPLEACERVKSSRERNREHARSTRLRKKCQIDRLKQEVTELLIKHREINKHLSVFESGEVSLDVHTATEKVASFLSVYFDGVTKRRSWDKILDPDVCLVIPSSSLPGQTPTDPSVDTKSENGSREIVGIAKVLKHVASMGGFTRTLEARAFKGRLRRASDRMVRLSTALDPDSVIVHGRVLMCAWCLRALDFPNADDCSAEMRMEGMLECSFSSNNLISKLVMSYDTLAVNLGLNALADGGAWPRYSQPPVTSHGNSGTSHFTGQFIAVPLNLLPLSVLKV